VIEECGINLEAFVRYSENSVAACMPVGAIALKYRFIFFVGSP
jgi:hypothetical protein